MARAWPRGAKFKYRIHLWPSDALSDPAPKVFNNRITDPPYELERGKTYYWYIEFSPNGIDNNWPVRSPAGDGTYYRFTTTQ